MRRMRYNVRLDRPNWGLAGSTCLSKQRALWLVDRLPDMCFGLATTLTDRWFCLGSQFAPRVMAAELRSLLEVLTDKGWLELGMAPKDL